MIELYQQAIQALGHVTQARETLLAEVELRYGLRNAHLALGELDAIPVNMQRALALADTLDDARQRARLTGALAHYHWLIWDLPPAFDLARRAIDLAERSGEAVEVALARGILGRVHWARGEYGTAAALFRKNLEVEPSEIPRGVAATAIPVMRPSACLMLMIAPCSPDTVSPGYPGLYEGRHLRGIGRMTYLPVTVFANHVAKPAW